MSFNNHRIAVVGATGNVGRTMLTILLEKGVPAHAIDAIASKRSAGLNLSYGAQTLTVQNIEGYDFSKVTFGLFSPGSSVSKIYAPKAAAQGCTVIDNTSFFRMDPSVPLVIPEINFDDLSKFPQQKLISNPNCVVAGVALALFPLHEHFTIKRVTLSTYQSVSGAGKAAIDELITHTKDFLNDTPTKPSIFKKSMVFNVLPAIGTLDEAGQTDEETKIQNEIKKIISPTIQVNATCVRVPVIRGHSASVNVELEKPIDLHLMKSYFHKTPGILFNDEDCLTPIECEDNNWVGVSRLRLDPSHPNAVNLWVVSDNLRKGAALNAIQIAEKIAQTKDFPNHTECFLKASSL